MAGLQRKLVVKHPHVLSGYVKEFSITHRETESKRERERESQREMRENEKESKSER